MSTTTPKAGPGTPKKQSKGGGPVAWMDERTGLAGLAKKQLRKVFPDHWSFMLGLNHNDKITPVSSRITSSRGRSHQA